MKVRSLRPWEPRSGLMSSSAAVPPPPVEIIFRRSLRVADPIVIKADAPKRGGFTRSELIADTKAVRKY